MAAIINQKHTCTVNGVSFFLLMVLSSIVSGTDRLIILLKGINDKCNEEVS